MGRGEVGSEYDLFLSYARRDLVFTFDEEGPFGKRRKKVRVIEEFKAALEAHRRLEDEDGHRTCQRFRVCTDYEDFDLQRTNRRVMVRGLIRSHALLVVCSDNSRANENVAFELWAFRRLFSERLLLPARFSFTRSPAECFPEYFAPASAAVDLAPRPMMTRAEWREQMVSQSHGLVAKVWGMAREEVHDRFEEQLRSERRRRSRSIIAGMVLIVATIVAAGWGVRKRWEAIQATRVATMIHYTEDIGVAKEAWRAGDVEALDKALGRLEKEAYRDLRSFEYAHVRRLATQPLIRWQGALGAWPDLAHVRALAFAPDGKSLVAWTPYNQLIPLDIRTGFAERPLEKDRSHGANAWITAAIAFVDGGLRVAVPSPVEQLTWKGSHGAIEWDVRNGNEHAEVNAPVVQRPRLPTSFAASSSRVFAWGEREGDVWLWDSATGRSLDPLRLHEGEVHALVFSGDGRRLASGGEDGLVRLVEVDTSRPCGTFRGHSQKVVAVALDREGRTLASAGADRSIRVWDTSRPEAEPVVLTGFLDTVTCVGFSPNGRLVAAAGVDRSLRIWDLVTKQELAVLKGHRRPISCLAFSQQGDLIASGGGSSPIHGPYDKRPLMGEVLVWKVPTGPQRLELSSGHPGRDSDRGQLMTIGLPARRDLIFTEESSTGTVRTWSTANGRLIDQLPSEESELLPLQSHLVVAGEAAWVVGHDGDQVTLRDVRTRQTRWIPAKLDFPVELAQLSSDGRTLAVVAVGDIIFGSAKIYLIDLRRESLIRILDVPKGDVFTVALTHDGRTVVAGGMSTGGLELLAIWDVHTGRRRTANTGWRGGINSLAFSPDGSTLAVGRLGNSAAPPLTLWDTAQFEVVSTLPTKMTSSISVAYHPDGRTLAVSSGDGSVQLWDPITRLLRLDLGRVDGHLFRVGFSPDGGILAVGGEGRPGTRLAVLWYGADITAFDQAKAFLPREEFERAIALWARAAEIDTSHGVGRAEVRRILAEGESIVARLREQNLLPERYRGTVEQFIEKIKSLK